MKCNYDLSGTAGQMNLIFSSFQVSVDDLLVLRLWLLDLHLLQIMVWPESLLKRKKKRKEKKRKEKKRKSFCNERNCGLNHKMTRNLSNLNRQALK